MRIKSLILAALCMVTVGVYAQSNYPGEFTIYDWGNGAAAEAYNRLLDKFGKIE